ncbi:MAG: HEAT repeat domain-containing protein, partial [Phormidesmis sp. RL_2_1]|nr:HEAT repeat domain-containing protein [Phormidesmis sp. RL_2_1]
QELAKGWRNDPGTLTLLKDRAQNDDHWAVRRSAVQALAQGWKNDPTLFNLWCDFSINHPFKRSGGFLGSMQTNPRQTTLRILIQQYPSNPKTHELLADRAENDNDEKLRQWAKRQLEQLERKKESL